MTDKEVHDAVVIWIKSITGVVTIKAHGGGPRPDLPYCMVNMTGIAEDKTNAATIEFEELEDLNPEGEKEVKATPIMKIEWRFQIFAYGESPTDILRPIRSAFQLTQKTEELLPYRIHELGRINDVPEWVENAWEQRAEMDLFVHGLTRDGFVIDTISEQQPDYTITN